MEPLPPYAYVPGHWPHPTRHVQGHSYGKHDESPDTALTADGWHEVPAYRWGLRLFNEGFYWEAHEAWEGLWRIAPPESPERQLLQGLIKLAAAGVKLRGGHIAVGQRLAGAAAGHIQRVVAATSSARFAGLLLADLIATCDEVVASPPRHGQPTAAVQVMFPRPLQVRPPRTNQSAEPL